MLPIDTRVVIMCGVSGSGKTTVARSLCDIGYVRISADELVWRKYGTSMSGMSQAAIQKAYADANNEIPELLTDLIESGQRVVVDAVMCKRSKRDALVDICKSLGVEYVIAYMDTPKDRITERLCLRKGEGPDDQIVTACQLDRYLANFEKPQSDEKFITINQS